MLVDEARRIIGTDADEFSDEEIEKLIRDVDFLTDIAIEQFEQQNQV